MLKMGRDGRNLYLSTCDGEALEEWRKMLAMVGEASNRAECPACVAGLRRSLGVPVRGNEGLQEDTDRD
jgi:hypothetical protein